MQAVLLSIGILIVSQVSGSEGDRYGGTGAAESGNVGSTAADEQFPWDDDTAAAGGGSSVLPPETPLNTGEAPLGESAYESKPPVTSDTVSPPGGNLSTAADSTQTSAPQLKPSKLLESLLQPPASGQLTGRAIKLSEVVASASSRDEQTRRIELYWDLSTAMMDYHLSLLEATQLETLKAPIAQPGQDWTAAMESLKSRAQVSLNTALLAQIRLRQEMGLSAGDPPPVPADEPHCGNYDTRFKDIFSGRVVPDAQRLHELILLGYQDLRRRCRQPTKEP